MDSVFWQKGESNMTMDLCEPTAPSLFVCLFVYSFFCLGEILGFKIIKPFLKISACFKKASPPLGL